MRKRRMSCHLSGYQSFSIEERKRLVAEDPAIRNNFGAVCKAIGKAWSALTPQGKDKWKKIAERENAKTSLQESKANQEKNKIVADLENDQAGFFPDIKSTIKPKTKINKLSGYLLFQKKERQRIVNQFSPDKKPNFSETSKLVAAQWNNLQAAQKEVWNKEAIELNYKLTEEAERKEEVTEGESSELSEGEIPGPIPDMDTQESDNLFPFPVTLIKVDRKPQPNTYQLPDKRDMLAACKPEGRNSSVKVVYTCTPIHGAAKSPVKNPDKSPKTSIGNSEIRAALENTISKEKETPTNSSTVLNITTKPATYTRLKSIAAAGSKPFVDTVTFPLNAISMAGVNTAVKPVANTVRLPLNTINTGLLQGLPVTNLSQTVHTPTGITLQDVGTKLPANSSLVFKPACNISQTPANQILRFQRPPAQSLIVGQNAQLIPAAHMSLQVARPSFVAPNNQPKVRVLTPQQFEELKRNSPHLFKAVPMSSQFLSNSQLPGGVTSLVPGNPTFLLPAPLITTQSSLLSTNSIHNSVTKPLNTVTPFVSTATKTVIPFVSTATANQTVTPFVSTATANQTVTPFVSIATATKTVRPFVSIATAPKTAKANKTISTNSKMPKLAKIRSPSPPKLKSVSPVHNAEYKQKIPDSPPVLTLQPPQSTASKTEVTHSGSVQNGRSSPGTAHYTISGNTIQSVPLKKNDYKPTSDLCSLELPDKPAMRVAFRPKPDKISVKKKGKEVEVNGPIYTCNFCMVAFTDDSALKAHFLSKHTDDDYDTDPMPYKCYFCDIKFGEKTQLTEHMKKTHDSHKEMKTIKLPDTSKEKPKQMPHVGVAMMPHVGMAIVPEQKTITAKTYTSMTKSIPSVSTNPSNLYSVPCICCELHFPSKRDLCIHKLKKHVDIFNPSNSMTVEHSVSSQVTVAGSFKTINQDVIHKTTFCLSCGFPCKSNSDLGVHMYESHQGTYPCPGADCDRVFKERQSLKWHISSAHPKFRAYSCKFCSFCTYHQLGALRHLNVHTLDSRMKEAEILTKQLEKEAAGILTKPAEVVEVSNELTVVSQKKGQIQIGAVEEGLAKKAKNYQKTGKINIGPITETRVHSKKNCPDPKKQTISKRVEKDMLYSDSEESSVGNSVNDDQSDSVEGMDTEDQPYVYIERLDGESPFYASDSHQNSPRASPTQLPAPGIKRSLADDRTSGAPLAKKCRGSGKFPCLDCKQSFTSRDALTAHFSNCSDPTALPRVKCNLCFTYFQTVQALKSHRRNIHFKSAALNKLSCNKCDIAFSDKAYLERHLQNKHNE